MAIKLLYDQNLPPRLVSTLAAEFPDSAHVRSLGLARASDERVWSVAAEQGFTIVSKDTDFMQMSFVRGAPPKIVAIRRGNCSTSEIESLLRESAGKIRAFLEDDELTYLLLH